MRKFRYQAKDKGGELIEAHIDASSRYAAIDILKQRDLVVISLEEIARTPDTPEEKKKLKKRLQEKHIPLEELAVFCRQLSIAIDSGLSLTDALDVIAEDMSDPYFRGVVLAMIQEIHNGKRLSEVIIKYPKIFSSIFTALIKSAEESGSISETFRYLSDYLERAERLVRKVKSITAYPLFILVFFVIVIGIVTMFILPKFNAIFDSFGSDLPVYSKLIFKINTVMINNLPAVLIGVAVLIGAGIVYVRTERGRYHRDAFLFKLPYIGTLLKKVSVARFARTFGIMLSGGVAVETALEITSRVCGNAVLEESFDKVKDKIMAGTDISSSLREDPIFPRLLVRMVGIGETSGQLPQVLNRVSDLYEHQVESSIMIMTALFEPAIIVLFGALVLVLILAVYIPVFKLATTMH